MADPTSNIVERAIEKYEIITKVKLDLSAIARLKTVDDVIDAVAKEQEESKAFREKHRKFFDRLLDVMHPVETLGAIAGNGASKAFPPSGAVFGAVTHLVNSAKEVAANFDAIEGLMEWLQVSLERIQGYLK